MTTTVPTISISTKEINIVSVVVIIVVRYGNPQNQQYLFKLIVGIVRYLNG